MRKQGLVTSDGTTWTAPASAGVVPRLDMNAALADEASADSAAFREEEPTEVRPAASLPRLAAYGRVSTGEQAESGAGMAAQRAAIAAGDGSRYRIAQWHEDAGLSAKTLDRPGLTAALAACSSGEVEGIIVAKLDRLSRSVIHFGTLLERSRKEGWHLIALDLGVDTTTAGGELVANVLMAVAQWERKVIGERTKAALAEKRAQGVRLGRPPSIPQKVRERILAMREEGLSYGAIANRLNADGVKPSGGGAKWWDSTVRAVVASG